MSDTPLAKEGLARLYGAVYTQFSAVTHYNRYSIEMVEPEQGSDGKYALSMGKHWPGLLIHQTGWLDMIQCSEACKVGLGQDATIKFEITVFGMAYAIEAASISLMVVGGLHGG